MNTMWESHSSPVESGEQDVYCIAFTNGKSVVDHLGEAETRIEATTVCLDFEEIESVNSAELSALVRFALRLRRQERIVSLCNVGPHLEEIFEITRFAASSVS